MLVQHAGRRARDHELARGHSSRDAARHHIGVHIQDARRIDAFRDAHPEHPIVDVQYADLVTDPAGTVASIYRAVGDELDDTGARAIAAYLEAHPRGEFGAHRYDVSQYGLDAGALAERFAAYTDRYAVPREH
jgi:hypothetical protein